jgi:putative adhesin
MDQKAPVPNHSKVQVETFDRSADPAVVAPSIMRERSYKRGSRRGSRWFVWLIGCILGILLLALLACALIGGLVMGIAIKLANEVTASSTTTQTFTVSDIPALDIHNASGNVQVRRGMSGIVTLQITRTARDASQSTAQANLDKIAVHTTQTGDRIAIATDFQDVGFFASSSTVNLLITVPPSTNIAADVTAGGVQIDSITGQIEITSGAGNVALQDVVLADGSQLHVATGSVTVRGALAVNAAIDITLSTGDVTLQLAANTTSRLDARTNVGAIQVNGWALQPTSINGVGAVVNGTLGAQAAGTIRIRVDTGDITVSRI